MKSCYACLEIQHKLEVYAILKEALIIRNGIRSYIPHLKLPILDIIS